MRQGDTVVVQEDTENLDPRWWEMDTVPGGTVARIAGWRGLEGVVLTWGRESAVVARRFLRLAPRGKGK